MVIDNYFARASASRRRLEINISVQLAPAARDAWQLSIKGKFVLLGTATALPLIASEPLPVFVMTSLPGVLRLLPTYSASI
jgi:hypothetical protein